MRYDNIMAAITLKKISSKKESYNASLHRAEKQSCPVVVATSMTLHHNHYSEHPGKHCDYHMGRGNNSDHTTSSGAETLRPELE